MKGVSLPGAFLYLLTLVFVTAKLWGRVDWPWILVFSPILLPLILMVGVLVFAVLINNYRAHN